jgi:hypothetical protein
MTIQCFGEPRFRLPQITKSCGVFSKLRSLDHLKRSWRLLVGQLWCDWVCLSLALGTSRVLLKRWAVLPLLVCLRFATRRPALSPMLFILTINPYSASYPSHSVRYHVAYLATCNSLQNSSLCWRCRYFHEPVKRGAPYHFLHPSTAFEKQESSSPTCLSKTDIFLVCCGAIDLP